MAYFKQKKIKPLTEKDRKSVEDALKILEKFKRRLKMSVNFVKSNGTVYTETGWYKDEEQCSLSAESMLKCLGDEWKIEKIETVFDGRGVEDEE